MSKSIYCKLYALPVGAMFEFGGNVFCRGKYLPGNEHYECEMLNDAVKLYLHKFTSVKPLTKHPYER